MKKILICAISNNYRSSFVNYQFECFKKFMGVDFDYILFDNSDDCYMEEYKRNCDYIGANYVKIQSSVNDSIDFIIQSVNSVMNFKGTALIVSLDLFLVREYNPLVRLENYSLIKSPDTHDFLIINFNELNNKENNNKITVEEYTHLTLNSAPPIFKEYKKNIFSVYDDVFLKYESNDEGRLREISEDNLFTFLCNILIDWNIPYDEQNKYIISFSLYGNNPRYTHNAIINAILAQKIYKGWICRFYYDNTVPNNIIEILESFNNVNLVKVDTTSSIASAEKMFWRFYPASENDVAVMIVRDADAWLGFRDAFLVKKWIESDKMFHIIRDHCYHTVRIMGGMWGVKRGKLPQLKNICQEQVKQIKSHGADQNFMSDVIYPLIVDSSIIHVSNGYKNDKFIQFESYPKILEFIPGIDIEKANDLNPTYMGTLCEACNKTHTFFIGGAFINQLQTTRDILISYGL